MLPVERVIGESGLEVAGDRARVEVRLPWYRSLPLSTVRIEKVAVDSKEVPLDKARFEVGGLSAPVPELENLTNDFWFVLDSGYVSFPADIEPGSKHQVDVTVTVFPPYIPGMRRMNSQSETLVAGEAK
jgi:hypothetical protein